MDLSSVLISVMNLDSLLKKNTGRLCFLDALLPADASMSLCSSHYSEKGKVGCICSAAVG